MILFLVLGLLFLGVVMLASTWFVSTPPADLARAVRTFLAVFSALASTGLLFAGRFGLALITVGATVVAIRSLRGPSGFGPAPQKDSSAVTTDLLSMRLDHASGELEGEVRKGPLAGKRLSDLGLSDLRALLELAMREDPPSTPLLETYLDRRQPDWREQRPGGAGVAPDETASVMDERTALEILGLEQGAPADAIKAAHRRLMARLHPDHGGSDYLAAQINRARDYLLHHRG